MYKLFIIVYAYRGCVCSIWLKYIMARNITPFGWRSLLDPGRGGEGEGGRGGEGRGEGEGRGGKGEGEGERGESGREKWAWERGNLWSQSSHYGLGSIRQHQFIERTEERWLWQLEHQTPNTGL